MHIGKTLKLNKILLAIGMFLIVAVLYGVVAQAEGSDGEPKAVTSVMGVVIDKGTDAVPDDTFDSSKNDVTDGDLAEDDMDKEMPETIIAGTKLESSVAGKEGFSAVTVVPVDIEENCILEIQTQSFVYTGEKVEPVVGLTYKDPKTGDLKILTIGKDYQVSYADNVNAGTGVVTVTGIGSYTGTVSANYVIEQKSIKNCTVFLGYTEVVCDGKEKKPSISVFYKSLPLSNGKDYTVTYKNNVNPGTATISINGIGNWKGLIEKSFTIKCNNVKELSYTPHKGSISLSWKQVAGATGYEIFRSTAENGSYTKLGASATNTFTDQTASYNLIYYYKIRAYSKSNEEVIYGEYSAPLKVSAGEKITEAILPYEGVKYVYGGSSTKGWDCSGFTQWIMKNKFGVDIPRTTKQQVKVGTKVNKNNQAEWLPGDLIFFSKGGSVCHVAMYIGDGKMMHASSTYKKTIIVDVDDYNRRCTQNTMTHVRRVL